MNLLYSFLCKELEIANIEKNISQQVRKQIEQNQREYYLREQMKAINKELGEVMTYVRPKLMNTNGPWLSLIFRRKLSRR